MNMKILRVFLFVLLAGTSASSTTSFSSSSSTSSSSSVSSTSSPPSRHSNASASFDLWAYLPADWNVFCDVSYDADSDVNATISCNVTQNYEWRLEDLRTSLGDLVNSTGIEVAVTLRCDMDGRVSLPWPMRAPGLARLTVLSCTLLHKYADFNTSAERIPDSLRVLDMRDCVWLNEPERVDVVIRNGASVTSEYQCGQDSTLVTYRYRAISDRDIPRPDVCDAVVSSALRMFNYTLSFPDELQEFLQWSGEKLDAFINNTMALGGDYAKCAVRLGAYLQALKNGENPGAPAVEATTLDPNQDARDSRIGLGKINVNCLYEHLEVLDESQTVPLDRKHFENLVKNTQYPRLTLLNYSHTNLGEVPKEIREWRVYFGRAPLQQIDLSHNRITEVGNIPEYASYFSNVTTTLNLQFNNITKLSLQMFVDWSSVEDLTVDVRNNPIDCSCDMIDLKDLLKQLNDNSTWGAGPAMRTYRQHLSVMQCATPPELSGRFIGSLGAEELECYKIAAHAAGYLVVLIVVLLVVVVLLLVLLILALRYRKEVRILLFTRVHVVLPCGPRYSRGDTREKLYDAFVAHANQDSDWVLGSLLKRLEEPSNTRGCGPVKLCIHQRDFVVGKPIIDNIIDCIAASRHTIIVLSRSFAKSSWAMEELQQAYRQSLEERRRHLVVVRLEEVPEADMAPVLRRCCKTFTYIDASDSLFWDRLQYSLHIEDNRKSRPSNISNHYDNTTFSEDEDKTSNNHTVPMETVTGDINDNSGISKTEVFSEDMKMLPARDSTSSTPDSDPFTGTYRRVNPEEVRVDMS